MNDFLLKLDMRVILQQYENAGVSKISDNLMRAIYCRFLLKQYSQQVFIDLIQISHTMQITSHPSPTSLFSLLALLLIMAHLQALKLHSQVAKQEKEYDPDAYLASMSNLQARLSSDAKSIQQKFTAINLRLKDTNISDSEKLIYLQQNLANERDSLFNLQTYLNVPFALRSCQCLNLTQQQKDQLSSQIQEVQASINALQLALEGDGKGKPYQNPKCPEGKCAVVQEIRRQLDQMRSYEKIMSDTASSQCCKVVNYVYRDNLEAGNNWVYGNTNEKDYKLSLFNKSKDANLTQCPTAKPFANLITNACFNCPPQAPLFNLASRTCQPTCESQSMVLIAGQHQCDYNRTCEQGQYFNNNTHKCQKALGTGSSCPRERPVWNTRTLSCSKCDNSTPYFDTNVQSCRACTANQIWQEYTEECIDKATMATQCNKDQYYDTDSKGCLNIPPVKPSGGGGTKVNQGITTPAVNPNKTSPATTPSGQTPSSGTYSQCPPSTPFWSTSDLACYKCPDSTPSYNSNSNKCEQCPVNTTWSATSLRCQKQPTECPKGQTYDPATDKCQVAISCEANQVYNSATGKCDTYSPSGQIGMCPPESPFWNAKTLYCEKCDPSMPFYNKTAKECQSCPKDTAWDQNNQNCKSTLKQCPKGQTLNTTTNNCQTIKCPPETPIFNYATNKCEACPEGTRFNNATFICDSLLPQRTNTSVCPADAPYWNSQKLFCDACPNGQQQDASKKCQPIASHFFASQSHQTTKPNSHDLPPLRHTQIRKSHLRLIDGPLETHFQQ